MPVKRHKYRKVIAAVYNSPWAILPDKLADITALLDMRAQGIRLSREQIAERIGPERTPVSQPEDSRVALLNMFGTITQRANFFSEFSGGTSTEQFSRAFRAAVEDEEVSAIVINIDSPGGAVPGVQELSNQIFESRGDKPIIAVANPMMCSAAYWIGSAADEIVAIPSAVAIGSIGVLTVHREDSQAYEKFGSKHTVIRSNEFKAEGNPYEPLTEAAREYMEERVMKIHAQFVEDVARNRGVAVARVEADYGRGRAFLAADAVSAGLADRVATLSDVLSELGVGAEPVKKSPSFGAKHRVEKGQKMNKDLMTLLVRLGACDADEEQASQFIDQFYSRYNRKRPDDQETILFDIKNASSIVDAATFVKYVKTGEKASPIPANNTPPAQPTAPPEPPKASGVDVSDIMAAVNITSLPPEVKLELQGELVKEAKNLTWSQVLDKINAKASEHNTSAGPTRIRTDVAEMDKFRVAARDAVLSRVWGGAARPPQIYNYQTGNYEDWKPTAEGRNYGLQNLGRLAEKCLVMAGVPQNQVENLPLMQVARLVMGADPHSLGLGFLAGGGAYNLTGMFSNILLDASNVVLRRSYDEARVTFEMWMRQGPSLPDFKPVHKVIAGELGDPKAIPEDGEFEETTLSDGKESYKLTVWGSVFSHSWQLIVNDALNSFMEIPLKLGRTMRRKQNRLAYQALKDNPTMAETSSALFNATALASGGHNNLTTGALSTVADYIGAFNAMTRKMGEQKGLDDDSHVLNLMPQYVIYPMALRGIIRQTLGSPSGDTTNPGLVNIWQQGLTPIEEGELGATTSGGSDTAFYQAASSGDVDTIEYAYLQGLETPVIEQAMSFDRLGMRQRIYQAFAVKPLDFRGLQKHTGAG